MELVQVEPYFPARVWTNDVAITGPSGLMSMPARSAPQRSDCLTLSQRL